MGIFDWMRRVMGASPEAAQAAGAPAADAPAADASAGQAQGGPGVSARDEALRALEVELLSPLESGRGRAALFTQLDFTESLDRLTEQDPAAAVRVLRSYAQALPEAAAARVRLALIYERRREQDAARMLWEQLAQWPGEQARAYEHLGMLAERDGELAAAEVYYQRALGHDWSRVSARDACRRLRAQRPRQTAPPLVIIAHDPPPGYRIEHPLGRGGYGTVYQGFDETLQRPVAMKFLHAHLRRRPDQVEAFFNEARLVAALAHPGVVGLFELDAERLLLLMEFMTRGTLADRLSAGRPLSPRAALRCAQELCRTLAHVHARGIVHRDLKPANVLFRDTGDAVLGDFGIAQLEAGGAAGVSSGAATTRYAAPEALEAGRRVDRRADLLGVGLLIGETLQACAPPASPDARPAWFERALAALPDALRAPAGARLRPLIAADPDRRPDDAASLARTLGLLIELLEERDPELPLDALFMHLERDAR